MATTIVATTSRQQSQPLGCEAVPGHRSFNEIAAVRAIDADPERRAQVERYKREMERRVNRPWWRLVRLWDRLTSWSSRDPSRSLAATSRRV